MTDADPAAVRLEQLGADLARQVAAHATPGAAMAVWHAGRRVEAAAGFANAEAGIECDGRTIFQIGSITKVFTATLAMKLAEQGLLDLEAPVSRYLPALRIAHAPVPDSLTLRTLLDYSAGMEGDFFDDFGPGAEALERYVQACAALSWVHEPGVMRSYNTTAYAIAGRVIEVVTGQPFDTALAERLLRPLGMERFAFFNHDVARYRTAVGHVREGDGFVVADRLRLPHCLSAAGASLTTTARDLLRFGLLHLQRGVTESGARYLEPSSVAAMFSPSRKVPPGDSPLLTGWATLATDLGVVVVASGRTIEQNSFLFFAPERDFCAAILSNSASGAERLFVELGLPLLKDCTGLTPVLPGPPAAAPKSEVRLTAAEVAACSGSYTNSYAFEVAFEDGQLRATAVTTDPAHGPATRQGFTLTRLESDRFVATPDGAQQASGLVEFIRSPTDAAVVSHLATSGRLFRRHSA